LEREFLEVCQCNWPFHGPWSFFSSWSPVPWSFSKCCKSDWPYWMHGPRLCLYFPDGFMDLCYVCLFKLASRRQMLKSSWVKFLSLQIQLSSYRFDMFTLVDSASVSVSFEQSSRRSHLDDVAISLCWLLETKHWLLETAYASVFFQIGNTMLRTTGAPGCAAQWRQPNPQLRYPDSPPRVLTAMPRGCVARAVR